VAHNDDDDGVGAWKVIGGAVGAVPAIAAVFHLGLMPAIGTEAVSLMPMQQRTCLRQHAQIARRKQAFDGETSEIASIL
jgi:hypothetical protein